MVLVLEPPEDFTMVVIDDEPMLLELMPYIFRDMPVNVLLAEDWNAGLDLVKQRRPRLVFLDLNLPGMHGMEVLDAIVQFDPRIEVILFSGDYSSSTAVEAIRRGASDFLAKPCSTPILRARVARSLDAAQKNRQTRELESELLSSFQFYGMVGRSPHMLDVFTLMNRVAPHYQTALVTGPVGSGKQLAARALHALSPARNGPFVVCHCAGVSDARLESELFGYESGALPGTQTGAPGLFERADQGALYLDEIGELPSRIQSKLLPVLHTHEIQRLGSSTVRKINVRVIASSSRDLRSAVEDRQFREDLYYRLSAVHLQLPALAERREDLPLLQRHFVEKFSAEYKKPIAGISRRAQNIFSHYTWPENIRELESVIAHACRVCKDEVIDVRDLPALATFGSPSANEPSLMPLKDLEKAYALRILRQVRGDKQRAAEILGVSGSTLHEILAGGNAQEPD